MTTGSTATASTTRLHVVVRPADATQPTVVMLHGIGGSAESCAPLAEHLAAAGVATAAVDAPGYGRSADPTATNDVVADVIDALDNLSPDRPVVIIGTSWGGVIAMSVSLRRPDRVAGLVLADSTRGSGTSVEKAAAMRSRITELREHGASVVAAARATRLTAPEADPEVTEQVRRSMSSVRVPGFTAAAEFMAATDLGPQLTDIGCPTLVVVGEHDMITGVDESRLLAERIPNAQLRIIANAGHVAIQEQPAAVAALVVEFLEALS